MASGAKQSFLLLRVSLVLPVTPQPLMAKEAVAPPFPVGPRDQGSLRARGSAWGSWFPNPDTQGEAVPTGQSCWGGPSSTFAHCGHPQPLGGGSLLLGALAFQSLLSSVCVLTASSGNSFSDVSTGLNCTPGVSRGAFEHLLCSLPTKVTETGVPFFKHCHLLAVRTQTRDGCGSRVLSSPPLASVCALFGGWRVSCRQHGDIYAVGG